ncbi:MAG TPA: hypothetical protein VF989_15245 [Polyangiaceae bacterium]
MNVRSAIIVGFLLTACSRSDLPDCPPDTAAPVDAELLAFLGRARSAHHAADQLERRSDTAAAIVKLKQVTSGPRPKTRHAEVREVLADTLARIADLEGRRGDFEVALEHIEEGLGLAPAPSYFQGHLFEVRGLVEERRANTLKENGQEAEAAKATERALEAFEQAMKIQARVIDQSLEQDGGNR